MSFTGSKNHKYQRTQISFQLLYSRSLAHWSIISQHLLSSSQVHKLGFFSPLCFLFRLNSPSPEDNSSCTESHLYLNSFIVPPSPPSAFSEDFSPLLITNIITDQVISSNQEISSIQEISTNQEISNRKNTSDQEISSNQEILSNQEISSGQDLTRPGDLFKPGDLTDQEIASVSEGLVGQGGECVTTVFVRLLKLGTLVRQ